MRLLTIVIFIFASTVTAVEYKSIPDDFSDGTNHRVLAYSNNGKAMLAAMCNADGKTAIQFVTTATIFPDVSGEDVMGVTVKHKFVDGPKAETTNWFMYLMKYKSAFYTGDIESFITSASEASGVNLLFTKRADVYKFSFGDNPHLFRKIIEECPSK